MEALAIACRLALAFIFGFAAATKIMDRNQFQSTVRAFGVPHRLVPALGWTVPVCELLTALLLLFPRTAKWGAGGAAVLLGTFTLAIVANLVRGNRPACSCFGRRSRQPLRWQLAGRNVFLLAIALVAGWGANIPFHSIANREQAWQLGSGLSLSALVLLLWLFWVHPFAFLPNRQPRVSTPVSHAVSSTPAPVPPPRPTVALAPDFSLQDLAGSPVSLAELLGRKRPVLLVFVNVFCGRCVELLPDLAHWQRELANQLTIVPISSGPRDENSKKAAQFGLSSMLLQTDVDVASRYHVRGTPSAVVVSPDGAIWSELAEGVDAIRALTSRFYPAAAREPVSHAAALAI